MKALIVLLSILICTPSFAYTDCTPDIDKYEKVKRGMSKFVLEMVLGCDGELVEEIYINSREQKIYEWDGYGGNGAFIRVVIENYNVRSKFARNVKRNPVNW